MELRRVALFLQSLGGGGTERACVNLANEFVRRGVAADLVVVDPSGSYRALVTEPVRVVKLPVRRMRYAVPSLKRYLDEVQPTVMLSSFLHANLVATAAWMLGRSRTRLILKEDMNPAMHRGRTLYWRFRAAYLVAPFFYKRVDRIVAVSHGVANAVASVYGVNRQRVSTIYNPIVSDAFGALMAEPVDEPWLNDQRLSVVLGAGRLVPQKSFQDLVRAFAALGPRRDLRLIIIGEGPDRSTLETLVRDLGLEGSVRMPGFVSNPVSYMARAKAFVLSSVHEGQGMVLVEAMAAGVPVVATDCPSGPAEVLEDGRYGILVPVGDIKSLAAGIEQALEVGTDTAGARRRAMDFSVGRIADEYLQLFSSDPC